MLDLRSYRDTNAKLADWLPWAGLVAPGVVLNKDGAFQRTLEFRGPDLDSSTEAELMGAAKRLDNALKRLGSGWCLHMEARRAPAGTYPDATWPEALSWLIDEERRQAYEAAGRRYESCYFLTLAFLPPSEGKGRLEAALFDSAGPKSIDYRACLDQFIAETNTILDLLDLVFAEARFLDDEETLTFLHGAISDRPHRVAVPKVPFHIDSLIADAPLLGGTQPMLGAKHLRIVSARAYVSETEPGLLDALNRLPIAYRWVTRYLPLDREDARREIEKIRKRWFSKRKGLLTLLREALFREEAALIDNDAGGQAEDADLALQDLQGQGCGAGFVTLTITIAEENETDANEAVRMVQQAADGLGFVTAIESINAVEAWLGSLPGQAYADLRRPMLLTPSLAHILPLSAVWAGEPENSHLARSGAPASALMMAATDGATPFRLNLHHGDVGHTLIVGPTGAGKSVLLGALAAQWRRYRGSQVFVLDAGRSARALTLGLGGAFIDLMEEGEGIAFQPLGDCDQQAARAWARDWLIELFTRAKAEIDPTRRDEIWRALGVLGGRAREERTLSVLAGLLQDHELRQALAPYTHDGPYGRLLDACADPTLDRDVIAFEMGELLRAGDALAALLPVLVRALERRFDGRPTLLILDEAWAYLRDGAFASQIQAWLKTLRKRNVAVVFATQELADVEGSGIAATIAEACPTRIFLANDRAREPRTAQFYAGLGLNTRQIQLIAEAAPKRDYYVQTRKGARLIDLDLGAAALAFLGASRPEDHVAIDRVLKEGDPQRFGEAWLRARGLTSAADAIARFNATAPRTPTQSYPVAVAAE